MNDVLIASPEPVAGTPSNTSAPDIHKHDNDFILRILRNATDLSAGSEELDAHIHNWYSSRQLSAARADLLRPFAGFLAGRTVLELGAAGGALTRYLGETCQQVISIENNTQLAAITAERCRDLANVRHQSTLANMVPQRFDVVFMGDTVSTVLFPGTTHMDPAIVFEKALLQARNFLSPGGVIIVGITNPTSLAQRSKDQSLPWPSFSFSRKKTTRLLATAGFTQLNWYYPFPDNISPSVILTQQAFHTTGFNAADIISPHINHSPARSIDPMLVQSLVESELMTEMSNAFLVIAGSSPVPSTPPDALAYTYNSGRRRAFKKENLFIRQAEGIIVQKELLNPQLAGKINTCTQHHVSAEKYVSGKLYADKLTEVLSTPGWTIEDVFIWAHPYYCFLNQHAVTTAAGRMLPGRWIDATPFNVVQQAGGRLEAIDLEWDAGDTLPLSFVFFRGCYHCLLRLPVMATPEISSALSAFELIEAVLKNFERNCDAVSAQFIQLETTYFSAIVSGKPVAIKDFILPFVVQQQQRGSSSPGIIPLSEIDLQVFVETDEQPFAEDHSVTCRLQLNIEKQVHALQVAVPAGNISRIRIDPASNEGMLRLWSITILEAQQTLLQWSPFSIHPLQLIDAQLVFFNDTAAPVLLLLSNDPMLIVSLDKAKQVSSARQLTVKIEMAAVPESEAATLQEPLNKLCAAYLHVQLPAA